MRCASHGLVTFRVEQSSVGRGSAIATLVRISRYTLLAGASDHLEVLRQFSDGAHRLDANDSEVLLVGDVQSSVERAHHHVVLVVHVWNAVYSHIIIIIIIIIIVAIILHLNCFRNTAVEFTHREINISLRCVAPTADMTCSPLYRNFYYFVHQL